MTKDPSLFSNESSKTPDLETKLLQRNLRAAKPTLGAVLGPRMTAQLKVLGQDYGFSVEAGELQVIEGNWYVTHTGLLRLAGRKKCSGIRVEALDSMSNSGAIVSCSRQRYTRQNEPESSWVMATLIP